MNDNARQTLDDRLQELQQARDDLQRQLKDRGEALKRQMAQTLNATPEMANLNAVSGRIAELELTLKVLDAASDPDGGEPAPEDQDEETDDDDAVADVANLDEHRQAAG